MPIVDIHGKKVHIDEGSDSAKRAVEFLTKHPDDARSFFDETHRDAAHGYTHFSIEKHEGYHGATDFTLVHNGDGQYELKKKEHHIF